MRWFSSLLLIVSLLCFGALAGAVELPRTYCAELVHLANQGNVAAQLQLGYCYEQGKGVAQNYNEAFRWYKKAADQGDALALNNLGVCYEKGKGTPRYYGRAVECYRKAAEQGLKSGQYNLGLCYLDGKGVTKDIDEAKRWFNKAARQGYEPAKVILADLGAQDASLPTALQAPASSSTQPTSPKGNQINNTFFGYTLGQTTCREFADKELSDYRYWSDKKDLIEHKRYTWVEYDKLFAGYSWSVRFLFYHDKLFSVMFYYPEIQGGSNLDKSEGRRAIFDNISHGLTKYAAYLTDRPNVYNDGKTIVKLNISEYGNEYLMYIDAAVYDEIERKHFDEL